MLVQSIKAARKGEGKNMSKTKGIYSTKINLKKLNFMKQEAKRNVFRHPIFSR